MLPLLPESPQACTTPFLHALEEQKLLTILEEKKGKSLETVLCYTGFQLSKAE